MTVQRMTVQSLLRGNTAFYRTSSYQQKTKNDMNSLQALSDPLYTYNTENKVWRIVKDILSVIILPIGVYKLLHAFAGKLIVIASCPAFLGKGSRTYDLDGLKKIRKSGLSKEWKYKRFSVDTDGYRIDACIIGKANTLGNVRWVLASNGNAAFYENKLSDHSFKQILTELGGNAIVFNYPGVGASTGMPSRRAMAKAYRAMLKFLEDKKEGIGAEEIIGYGHSFGGGVQGDALRSYDLNQDIKYGFVKSRTFSDLSTDVSIIMNRFLGFLVKLLGWNIDTVASSKELRAPEIIMQTASFFSATELTNENAHHIMDDGIIPLEASLAKKLLNTEQQFKGKKYFMGIYETHNIDLKDGTITKLTGKIQEMLERQKRECT
jgi:hypothetical protein